MAQEKGLVEGEVGRSLLVKMSGCTQKRPGMRKLQEEQNRNEISSVSSQNVHILSGECLRHVGQCSTASFPGNTVLQDHLTKNHFASSSRSAVILNQRFPSDHDHKVEGQVVAQVVELDLHLEEV